MPNVLSGRLRTGSPRPLQTFAPGQCIPASAIIGERSEPLSMVFNDQPRDIYIYMADVRP